MNFKKIGNFKKYSQFFKCSLINVHELKIEKIENRKEKKKKHKPSTNDTHPYRRDLATHSPRCTRRIQI